MLKISDNRHYPRFLFCIITVMLYGLCMVYLLGFRLDFWCHFRKLPAFLSGLLCLVFGLRGRHADRLFPAGFLIRPAAGTVGGSRTPRPGRGYCHHHPQKKKDVKNTQKCLTSKIAYDIVKTTAKTRIAKAKQTEGKKNG